MKRFLILLALLCSPVFAVAQSASSANSADLRWLDRTTGALQDITLGLGQSKTMGAIEVKLVACRYPAGSINRDAFAYLTIRDVYLDAEKFAGWMVASSPGLNALQHPRYDVWVIRCRAS